MLETGAIWNQQSEAGVIASLLYNPELLLSSDFLKAEYFYDSVSGALYYAIRELFNRGISVDAYTISRELRTNPSIIGRFDELNMPNIDEIKELGELIARSNPSDYVELAKDVMANAYKRDLERKLKAMLNTCRNDKVGIEDISTSMYATIEDLSKKYIVESDLREFGLQVDEMWEEIVEKRERDKTRAISWKWKIFDEYAPLEPGELYIIGGRRKAGKSIVLMNQALHLVGNDIPTLYCDSEMSDALFFRRVLTHLTGIEGKDIKSGNYSEEDALKIEKAKIWLKKKKFYHLYIPEYDKSKLYNTCRMLRDSQGLQVVVYDYLKANELQADTNYNALGAMTDTLKNTIGGDLKLTVLSGCQLNRQNEVADSDKIERYATTMFRIAPKSKDMVDTDGAECGNFQCRISCNRLGEQHDMSDPTDYIDMRMSGRYMRVEEAEKQHIVQKPFD